MAFSLPTDVRTDNDNTNAAVEAEPETTFGGDRIDNYEDYWLSVDMVRILGKSCKRLGVAKVKDAERSPWAAHYVHYRDLKNENKETCTDLKGNLPTYREEFGEPETDCQKITAENAEEIGLTADDFGDDEDPIFVPVDYEPPEVVFWAEAGEEAPEETVREALETVSRLGEKTSEEAIKALEEAGLTVVFA